MVRAEAPRAMSRTWREVNGCSSITGLRSTVRARIRMSQPETSFKTLA